MGYVPVKPPPGLAASAGATDVAAVDDRTAFAFAFAFQQAPASRWGTGTTDHTTLRARSGRAGAAAG
ncbi:DUF6207 family protein [Streptomyces sp. NPDC051636]|uniref:DUF6207 family protein n=1 Tax=Streptomyces sp. NPDC051636 TaxID=3365663 RepID=UPI0037A78EBE